jgi:DNA-binding transcriptional LysR family regulator
MARFDLNLLSALNALLSERNVTYAAKQLNVTQPTMSGMLQRLRYQFDDQLLVRHGRQMELTPFGASLVDPVRDAMRSVQLLVHAEPVFDSATSTREFRLMASDYCTSIFLPHVIGQIADHAPGVRLIVQTLISPVESMAAGSVDLCVTADDLSLFGREPDGAKLQSEHLFSDDFVCIVADDHPLRDGADVKELLSFRHVGVEMPGAVRTIDTVSLREHNPYYQPDFVVPDFSLIAPIVSGTRLVGIIQSRLARSAIKTLPVRMVALPYVMPAINETMLWHSRHIEDPAHAWLRSVLRDVALSHFVPETEGAQGSSDRHLQSAG